ncbi:MAG: ATP-binding protein, partial [Oscillospiraceae bacterium]
FSLAIRQEGDELKICSAHASLSSILQNEDEYRPISFIKEKLRLEDEKYETLVNSIPGGVGTYQLDETFSPIYISDKLCELCEMTREEYFKAIENSALDVIYYKDRKPLYDEIMAGIKENRKIEFTYRLLQKNNKYKWIHVLATTMIADGKHIICAVFIDADDLKKKEHELKEAKDKFQIALKNSNISMWSFNVATDMLYDGNGISTSLGFGEFPICSYKSLVDLGMVMPESANDYFELHNKIKNGEKESNAIIHFNKNLVDIEWQQIKYVTVFDEKGIPIEAIGIGEDLTQMKILESRYNNELLYKSLALKSTEASYNFNLTQNKVVELQNKLPINRDTFIYTTTQSIYEATLAHIIGDDKKEEFSKMFNIQSLIDGFYMGKTDWDMSYKYDAGNNEYLWLQLHINVMKNPKTGDIEAFSYINDITEKQMVKTLISSVITNDYDFVMCINGKKNSYTMYTNGLDSNLPPALCNDYQKEINSYLQSCVMEKERETILRKVSLEHIFMKLEKKDVYETVISIIEDGKIRKKKMQFSYINREAKMILHTRSDITNLFMQEQAQQKKLERALDDARIANLTKTEFLSRMSHEIRTPMNAIMGLAAIAKEKATDTDFVKECVDKSQIASKFLLSLINDILDMSRIESGKITLIDERIDFHNFIDGITTIINSTAIPKGVIFSTIISNDCEKCYIGDNIRLEQILINLLSNAVKFTPPGGKVELLAEQLSRKKGRASLRFTVTDTGIGISESFIKNIFSPFSQEHNGITSTYGGSGLGLAISQNLANLMGGQITVNSILGEGSTFVVEISLKYCTKKAIEQSLPQNDESLKDFDFSAKNILLVEDHELNILVATRILTSKGMSVVSAQNGKLGVEAFENSKENFFDAVLMDIRMPVMDGLMAASAIRNLKRTDCKKVPIIAMTANAFDEDIKKSLKAGMNAHLAKPIEPQKLFDTLAFFINQNTNGVIDL